MTEPITADAPAASFTAQELLTTRRAAAAVAGALVLGMAGDYLLRGVPWGLGFLLWFAALLAGVIWLQRGSSPPLRTAAWLPPALAAAALLAWRDSPVLKALDLTVIGVVLALAAWRVRGGRIVRAGVVEHALALVNAAFDAWIGAILLVVQDIRWEALARRGAARQAGALLRGIALALPAVAVFAALLVSADAAFERWTERLLHWDAATLAGHAALAAMLAVLAASVLRALALPATLRPAAAPVTPAPMLGIVEVGTVLTAVNALFLAFVVIQVPYLFGGAAAVEATAELSYAVYARRGFFELVAVAGLVIPLLLALHGALRAERPTHLRLFRTLAATQVALVGVMVASALHRMALYRAAYGVTELRLYTTAAMLWIAVVLAWFCATVLRGRRERFTFGALVAAGVGVLALHVADPDALIVRTNAARALGGAPFDAGYAATLSADAMPALVGALPRLPPPERCRAVRSLARRWGAGTPRDWRAWSVSRARARGAVSGMTVPSTCPQDRPRRYG